jgi:hypothetical protein
MERILSGNDARGALAARSANEITAIPVKGVTLDL